MAKTNNTHKMTDREIEIGQKIRTACLAINDDLTNAADAKDAKKTADASAEHGRLPVILSVAEMSRVENWTEAEAMWGCEYAASVKGNDDRVNKTIANFCSEMKSVTSPKVRDAVPTIVTACKLAWDAETEAMELDKQAPKPLREFAKRQYHLIIRAIKEQRLGTVYITDPESVVNWAEANDPAKNPDLAADKLASIAEQLSQIFVYFAHADIADASSVLAKIDAKALRQCRVHEDLTATLPKPPQKPVQGPEPTTPIPLAPRAQAAPSALPAAASTQSAAQGASDWLEEQGLAELAEAAD
jgi:hypothetical protein